MTDEAVFVPFEGRLPSVAEGAFVAPSAVLVGDVVIEKGASVWFHAVLRGDLQAVRVGARSNVQDGAVLHVTKALPVVIGEDVTVGHCAVLHGCRIGRGSLIGMSATVLDGAEIGEESIVAAGSVVSPGKKIPSRSMVMGVPGRVVRELTKDEINDIQANTAEYVCLAAIYSGRE
ncbi:gamma carbonic anhydrase family protein [Aminithiophilus ramosus]|uniref:Gamma carbonic anhydrase family protein n=2 Tax=Synergistales TaxID=649776 RepID=A0A9Q7EXL3_9BACT|nr:gamma carbonic anhydrase family protein [Aminithiophilus ramosus]QVL37609.1 gamma carbonic anhydrase family protein [Synergistota bacterium]